MHARPYDRRPSWPPSMTAPAILDFTTSLSPPIHQPFTTNLLFCPCSRQKSWPRAPSRGGGEMLSPRLPLCTAACLLQFKSMCQCLPGLTPAQPHTPAPAHACLHSLHLPCCCRLEGLRAMCLAAELHRDCCQSHGLKLVHYCTDCSQAVCPTCLLLHREHAVVKVRSQRALGRGCCQHPPLCCS